MNLVRHAVLHRDPLKGHGGGIVRAALTGGFEVIVARIVEDDVVVVTGLHPFRGRFVARFGVDGSVAGSARVVDYVDQWTIRPDLRSDDPKEKADKRKPLGIGVEKLARTDGVVTVTTLRAWLKKE